MGKTSKDNVFVSSIERIQFSPRALSTSTMALAAAAPSPCGDDLLKISASNPTPKEIGGGYWSLVGSVLVRGDFSRWGSDARYYEYRQSIKGRIVLTIDGIQLPQDVYVYHAPGTPTQTMSNTEFKEDGCGNQGAWRYGHRHDSQSCDDNFYDDSNFTHINRASGPYYRAYDYPGMTNFTKPPSSVIFLIDMHFVGSVVKVDGSGNVLETICYKTWDIYFNGSIP